MEAKPLKALLTALCQVTMASAALLSGCNVVGRAKATPKPVEIPVANVPRSLREWNWGGGSCVHAATVAVFRWQNAMDLAAYWRKTYSGGESYEGLTSKLQRNKVPYYSSSSGGGQDIAGFNRYVKSLEGQWYGTLNGDVDVLERCTIDRRGGTIFYYPNHSIMFCGFTPDGKDAVVLDNNRIEKYIVIEKKEFIRKWRGYGGVCVVPTIGNPRPPIPYVAHR